MTATFDNPLHEAVILCGGLGTRIRSIVPDRPKGLVVLNGRPFLEWLIRRLSMEGIRRVVLATGYLGEMIEAHFGQRAYWGVEIAYSRETSPLGTAGALRLATGLTSTPHLLVLNGDTFCDSDLKLLLRTHITHRAVATLWLVRLSEHASFGAVELDSDGAIRRFEEKSGGDGPRLINAGTYVFERDIVIGAIAPNRVVSLEYEVLPSLVGHGLYGIEGPGAFVDIGSLDSLSADPQVLQSVFKRLELNS